MGRKLLAFSFLIFWTVISQAKTGKWTEKVSPELGSFDTETDTFIETVLGACRVPQYRLGWLDVEVPGKENFRVRNPLFKYGSVSTDVFFHRDKSGQKVRAPLLVVLPGIFSHGSEPATASIAEHFWRRGYHVLVIPNPWTLSFMSSTQGKMGDLVREAKENLSIIVSFQDFLKKEKLLGRTQVIGFSYGAFLGSILSAFDAEGERRIDGQTLLVGSPVFPRKVFKRLDRLVDETQPLDKKTGIFQQRRYFSRFCRRFVSEKLSLDSYRGKELAEIAKMFVAIHGFHGKLRNMVSAFDMRRRIGHRPDPRKVGYDQVEKWGDALRFETWFDLYAKEVLDRHTDDQVSLHYWVSRTQKSDPERILVLSAENDFLNEPYEWAGFGEELKLVKKGGHLGFCSDPRFLEIADRVFDRDRLPTE